MKDNDLLVTELYKDPSNDHITAISVYLTPKTTSKWRNFVYSVWIYFDSKPSKTYAILRYYITIMNLSLVLLFVGKDSFIHTSDTETKFTCNVKEVIGFV